MLKMSCNILKKIIVYSRCVSSQVFFGFKPEVMSTQVGESNLVTNISDKGKDVNVTEIVAVGPSQIVG